MSTQLYPQQQLPQQFPFSSTPPNVQPILPHDDYATSQQPQAITLIKTEQHAKSLHQQQDNVMDAQSMEEEVIWILPQTFLSVFSTPQHPVSSSQCDIDEETSNEKRSSWSSSSLHSQQQQSNVLQPTRGEEDESSMEMMKKNPTQFLLSKFSSEKHLEQIITQKACRSQKTLEKVQNNEGRYCEVSYPDVHLRMTLYYFLHEQCWYVVGLKFLNTNPELMKIESVDLVECRAVIPTLNYCECTGGGTSPTVGHLKQFETEYEYTFQLVLNSGAVYELIVSGLGMIHFQMMSTRPLLTMQQQQSEQQENSAVYVAGENENDDFRGELSL